MSIETWKNSYVVQYIDFGNCAIVDQRNIYPVEKKFMQLPKLAVLCSLKDIVPNNNNLNWSEVDNNALDSCFNADKYECIFHSFNDEQYIISLNRNGQDVGDLLIQQKLAVLATTTSVETIGGKNYFNIHFLYSNIIYNITFTLRHITKSVHYRYQMLHYIKVQHIFFIF